MKLPDYVVTENSEISIGGVVRSAKEQIVAFDIAMPKKMLDSLLMIRDFEILIRLFVTQKLKVSGGASRLAWSSRTTEWAPR